MSETGKSEVKAGTPSHERLGWMINVTVGEYNVKVHPAFKDREKAAQEIVRGWKRIGCPKTDLITLNHSSNTRNEAR